MRRLRIANRAARAAASAMIRATKNWLKSRLYERIGVSFNPFGVPFSLAKHLQNGRPVFLIDVGAHGGGFTRSIDRFCGVKRGLLVEAQPDRASALASLFRTDRFEVKNCAVCDRAGEIELEINEFDVTTSMLRTRREMPELGGVNVQLKTKVRCKTARLDDLVSTETFPRIDLLKLDVQGAEHLVIKGAPESLRRTNMVWTEVSFVRLYEDSSLFHEIHALLREKGFALVEFEQGFRSPTGEVLQADALFIRT